MSYEYRKVSFRMVRCRHCSFHVGRCQPHEISLHAGYIHVSSAVITSKACPCLLNTQLMQCDLINLKASVFYESSSPLTKYSHRLRTTVCIRFGVLCKLLSTVDEPFVVMLRFIFSPSLYLPSYDTELPGLLNKCSFTTTRRFLFFRFLWNRCLSDVTFFVAKASAAMTS